MSNLELARAYHAAVHAAAGAAVDAEAEAQLTTPVSNLFAGLAAEAELGELWLIRETRLDHSRPDFAVLLTRAGQTRQKGFIELKAPSISVDASTWSGRNARQWANMAHEAEILIVCNGVWAQVYRDGEPYDGAAELPFSDPDAWRPDGLVRLLRLFIELNPTPIVSVRDLSIRLAVRTADLRDRLLWLLDESGLAAEAAKGGYRAWRQHVQPTGSARDFADGVSQVLAYGMVIATLGPTGADPDGDGFVTVAEARVVLRRSNPVLAAAFAPLMDKPALADAAKVELGALETLISAIDVDRVNASADSRGEPWRYFYEDFLAAYDPDERRQAGVYYTPVAIVQAMAHMVDHLLVERFGRRLGFAERSVVTLDPAAGSGAFPLAAIDKAVERATAVRGSASAGRHQAAANLAESLFAFELLPGPYSVSHLRLGQRLTELRGSGAEPLTAQVVLTDTLESPFQPSQQAEFFGDAEVLAAEQHRAQQIKLEQQVTVVIGNPPYRRVERDIKGRGSCGWVLSGAVPGRTTGKSLFDDILDVARANTIFSHHASLYNLYVYFWRWALWKAFEAHGPGPGVVAYVTGSSWLAGPGFVGLRRLARELADDIWVVDLGGDNHGANPEENVFAIETPVAVVVLARDAASKRTTPARVRYRRVRGTAEAKLAAMSTIAATSGPLGGEWTEASSDWMAPFTPPTGDAQWTAMPLITDIFPWQQPGCKFGRTWPVAPSPELLAKRWEKLAAAPREQKPALFFTATSGRNAETKVEGFRRLSDTKEGDAPESIQRYGYRSFDRQWALDDPRLAKTDSPSLWQSVSNRQVFLSSILTGQVGVGPALTVSAHVPDLHYFHGRGGKDIIPLWRDRAAAEANLTDGVSELLGRALGIAPPGVEEVAAYVYALLSASAYQTRFAEALRTPGLRVPITADAELWREAAEAGRYRLWLQTYAERFGDPVAGRGLYVPLVDGIGWEAPVTRIPKDGSGIAYDEDTQTLTVGNGKVFGVQPGVWAFEVSGMLVLSKWLGYRTAKGAGRAASSKNDLDRIRPLAWPDAWNDELLDLIRVLTITLNGEPALADLLERICDGPLIEATRLPMPKSLERKPPAKLPRVSVLSKVTEAAIG
jgi:hypothetical protein